MKYIVAMLLLLAGCTATTEVISEPAPVVENVEPKVPEPEPIEPEIEEPTVIEVPDIVVEPQIEIEYHEVKIIVDDEEFDPKEITVPQGPVRLTFIFDEGEIDKGGMDIKSPRFNVYYRTADFENVKIVEFNADFPFRFIGFRPGSDVIKISGNLEIE